ncbi:MAG: SH3 domain-containing protein [Anaerolineae bacterium]|nr:SH3 domain-containing protein [Anaerolineae bacterium]
MRLKRLVLVCLLLTLGLSTVPVLGQEQPLVVFVLNPDLGVSSVFDGGPNGISALDEIFQSLGAETQVVNLVDPIPTEADVIVLIGPQQRLSLVSIARIWVHLAHGKNLLMALDPVNYAGMETENFNSGLLRLLTSAYGIRTLDTFLAEPWFTRDSVALLGGTSTFTYPDVIPHPVVEPLIDYDLPVLIWGARTMLVEPIGVDSLATPLLQNSTGYAETNSNVFNFAEDAPPLELNLEDDLVGRLDVAGLGENTLVNSRLAVLGDAEMLQNGYGLINVLGSSLPRNLGNYIFAQRLAAWLLDLPESEWPSLPEGFTWINVDGQSDDWDMMQAETVESPAAEATEEAEATAEPQVMPPAGIRALRNNAYLYLLLETADDPSATVEIQMADGTVINATTAAVQIAGETIPDAKMAVDSVTELRLPLRIAGGDIEQVCVSGGDCMSVTITDVADRDPFELRFPSGPLATVTSIRDIALMSQPVTGGEQVASLRAGDHLQVIGRDESGDWLQVDSAEYTGWLLSSLVVLNADIHNLPIIVQEP